MTLPEGVGIGCAPVVRSMIERRRCGEAHARIRARPSAFAVRTAMADGGLHPLEHLAGMFRFNRERAGETDMRTPLIVPEPQPLIAPTIGRNTGFIFSQSFGGIASQPRSKY